MTYLAAVKLRASAGKAPGLYRGGLVSETTKALDADAPKPERAFEYDAFLSYAQRLWNADTGQPVGQPLRGHTDPISSVAFTPDGLRLVSGSEDKTVRLWNARTGQPIGQPSTATTGAVNDLAVSADGRSVAAISADHTLSIWPIVATPEMLFDKLVANMSHKQWHDWISPDIPYTAVCPGLPIAPD
jgi:WD40 repeat protein